MIASNASMPCGIESVNLSGLVVFTMNKTTRKSIWLGTAQVESAGQLVRKCGAGFALTGGPTEDNLASTQSTLDCFERRR